MSKPVALLDACVLFPAPLRDLWMHLILTKTFQGCWSDQIHEEWIRNALARRPELSRPKLESVRDLMNLHALDALVVGFETLIPSISLPDADDRHVVAAALKGEAASIVTFNLKDFPSRVLEPLGLEAVHPDDFALRLLESNPDAFVQAAANQRANLLNPPKSVDDYLATLANQGLTQTAGRLGQWKQLL